MAEAVRRAAPAATVVLGGVHASTVPASALAEAPAFDHVLAGEGEAAMVELASGVAPEQVAGLWLRRPDDGAAICPSGPRAPAESLDDLAWPLREGLLWAEGGAHPVLREAVITVRGCPYRCIYCAVPGLDDRRTRYRSAEGVTDEIEALREQWDPGYLFFHDSVFTMHRRRTLELCDRLAARGPALPFTCQTRADRVDPEIADALARAGCNRVFLGIESGDTESLRRMRKDVPLKQVTDAIEQLTTAGVACSGYFMVGFPWEDPDSIGRTAQFATSVGLDSVSLFSATPLPGTELWDLARQDARRVPSAPDFRRPQVNLTAMPDDEYASLFGEVRARCDAYNASVMNGP